MICKNCHKPREKHFPDPNYQWIKEPFWCIINARKLYQEVLDNQLDARWFTLIADTATWSPMDNLTYIEYKAKERKLI